MEITEEKLNKLIKETVDKYVERIIAEYADPRNKFIDKVDATLPQIVENWCLVHYCSLIGEDINNCKGHWQRELKTALIAIGSRKLKGNNSPSSRYKAFEEGVEYSELLDDYDTLFSNCITKFETENINWEDNELYNQCIKDLLNNKTIILDLLSNYKFRNIIDYINTI